MQEELWKKVIEFHGHACPGLAMGFRAALEARKILGITSSEDEEIVCVTENDACGVDAIQALLSCTVGKGNLIFRIRGKQAFSFYNRNTGKSARLVLKNRDSKMEREEYLQYLLTAPFEEIYSVGETVYELPERARIFNSYNCAVCGEKTAENHIRVQNGEYVCEDCLNAYTRGI